MQSPRTQQIIERAEREIIWRDKAIAALRDELGQLAILAAKHVLGRKLDAEADQKLVDEFLQELAQEGRSRLMSSNVLAMRYAAALAAATDMARRMRWRRPAYADRCPG